MFTEEGSFPGWNVKLTILFYLASRLRMRAECFHYHVSIYGIN